MIEVIFSISAYESSQLNSVLKWPSSSRPVMKELGWIVDGKIMLVLKFI
jgi:hypothetical protein